MLASSLLTTAVTSPAGAVDGLLDPTFGGDGKVVSDFGFDESATGVALQPDSRIVVVGTGCGGDFLVARYNSDGSLDASFGSDGWVCVDVGLASDDRGHEVLVLDDGRLLVAGTSGGDFAVVRLNPDGSTDPTFGTAGRALHDMGGADQLRDASLAPDGKVIMVGETTRPGCPLAPTSPGVTTGVAAVRITLAGTLDPTFGADGKVVRASESHVQRALAVAIQNDGAVVIGGRTASCTRVTIESLLFRLTAAGTPDTTFPVGAAVAESGPDSVADVAVDGGGNILVAIDTFVGPATTPAHDDAFTLARFNGDGSVDSSFGTNGAAHALFGDGTNATAGAIALQSERIVVGGSLDGDFALARFDANGMLDTSFHDDGKITTDFAGADSLADLVAQTDGRMVGAGRSNSDVALARYGTTTAPSTTTASSTTTSTSTTTTASSTTTSTSTTRTKPCRPGRGKDGKNRCHSGPPGQVARLDVRRQSRPAPAAGRPMSAASNTPRHPWAAPRRSLAR